MTLSAGEDAVLLVDPNGANEVAECLLELGAGFGVGIAGVVGNDGRTAVEVDAAGIGEGAEFEDAGGGENLVASGVGGLAFALEFGAALFGFGDFLVDVVAFFLGLSGGEGFAVAGDDAVDANAVDGEALGVDGGGFLEVAAIVEFQLLEVDVVGVVAGGGFGALFVLLEVENELGDGREGLVGER